MQNAFGLSAFAFLGVVFVFLLRAPNTRANPESRLTWLASGVGAVALLSSGMIIPAQVVDSLLGGTNIHNLVQNVCTTLAFWLVYHGIQSGGKVQLSGLPWLRVVAFIALFSSFYFMIDRGSTSNDFIVERSDQPALWAYASLYMGGITWLSVGLIKHLPRVRSLGYQSMILGAALVASGSVAEIIFLTLQVTPYGPDFIRVWLGWVFSSLFYPGVLLIALGMATLSLGRQRQDKLVRKSTHELEAIVERRTIGPSRKGRTQRQGDRKREIALNRLYALVIAAHDLDALECTELSELERASVERAEACLVKALALSRVLTSFERSTLPSVHS